MADQSQPAKSSAAAPPKQKFSDLSAGGKLVHVGKIIIFFISFGFAFPSIFSD